MLTVAIPTYNRSRHLERQLRWLARVLPGHESDVEVLISDNASTDDTPQVVEAWRPAFANVAFRYHRHDTNIGAIRNIASCIRSASRRHVWTIGDDDTIDDEALDVLLTNLRRYPDIGLITLNHSARFHTTGVLRFARCYPVDQDRYDPWGTDLATYCLNVDRGGLALTTSQVYRADLARQAQEAWPDLANLLVQVYWTAYCARHGGMLLVAHPHVECAAGSHFWTDDPLLQAALYLMDTPVTGRKLMELGFDRHVCNRFTYDQILPHRARVWVAAFLTNPGQAVRFLAAFTASVWRAGPVDALKFATARLVRRLRRRSRKREGDSRPVEPPRALVG